ncbi:hypothetical protein C5E45_31570 [Nocardia nova]|uniref:Uncharacterized protein n=3 Tax=Nocardia TaxID=1817 RepID=A0A2S6AGF8_9NOCA|nr:hypothetical protein C5E41_29905 [Nocardia nova]PPJ33837.1 hypothetical protein C5E45_31570 [Nocardia nova]
MGTAVRCATVAVRIHQIIERGESIMDSGSAAALEGIRQGYLNGDPVATALFIPLFFIAGIFGLIQGKPF